MVSIESPSGHANTYVPPPRCRIRQRWLRLAAASPVHDNLSGRQLVGKLDRTLICCMLHPCDCGAKNTQATYRRSWLCDGVTGDEARSCNDWRGCRSLDVRVTLGCRGWSSPNSSSPVCPARSLALLDTNPTCDNRIHAWSITTSERPTQLVLGR